MILFIRIICLEYSEIFRVCRNLMIMVFSIISALVNPLGATTNSEWNTLMASIVVNKWNRMLPVWNCPPSHMCGSTTFWVICFFCLVIKGTRERPSSVRLATPAMTLLFGTLSEKFVCQTVCYHSGFWNLLVLHPC